MSMLCNRIKIEIGINNNDELLETVGEHTREIKKDVRRYHQVDKPSSPLSLFLTLSHIFKVKLQLKFKLLIQISEYKYRAFSHPRRGCSTGSTECPLGGRRSSTPRSFLELSPTEERAPVTLVSLKSANFINFSKLNLIHTWSNIKASRSDFP
jgi:hypothetical protein